MKGGLGGKLGDSMTAAFDTDTVKDLLPVPVEQLKQKLGDDTGTVSDDQDPAIPVFSVCKS